MRFSAGAQGAGIRKRPADWNSTLSRAWKVNLAGRSRGDASPSAEMAVGLADEGDERGRACPGILITPFRSRCRRASHRGLLRVRPPRRSKR
ncbi:hypothetical protein ADL01_23580 [Streptomyces sp. NRRL WC-3618]|nr:hypothetical protein ADL01_23580 [Streptomyces sp. NRRL WC-3618]